MKNKRDWMDRVLDYPVSSDNATVAIAVVLFVIGCLIMLMQEL